VKTWIFGYDLSLTAPACVAIPVGWRPGDWKAVRAFLIYPEAPKADDVAGQLRRYAEISNWALRCLEETTQMPFPHTKKHIAGIFIEQYAFSRNNAGAAKLMELGGIARIRLWDEADVLPHTVNTSQARVLLLGTLKGIAAGGQKIAVQRALFDKGKAPRDWEENICDAFAVANWGLSEAGGVALILGEPSEPSSKKKRKAA